MAQNIDNPPLYDILLKRNLTLADVWNGWFSNFVQTLQGFVSENGIFLPQLTATEIAAIPLPTVGKPLGNTPNTSGQMLFDTTNHVPKVLVITTDTSGNVTAASWKTFTIT